MVVTLVLIITGFFGSALRAGADEPAATQDQGFVAAATQDFLGRMPTASELEAATSSPLGSVEARLAFTDGLAHTYSYASEQVDRLYTDLLTRSADESGLQFWTTQLTSGRTNLAEVAVGLVSSAEFNARFDGGASSSGTTDDAEWIRALYRRVLDRGPDDDPDGVAYWTNQADRRGRRWVATKIIGSAEHSQTRVTALYQRFLDRRPDESGLGFWTARLASIGDLALGARLAASEEFAARAGQRFPWGATPTAPLAVTATATTAAATITWQAPWWSGWLPIVGYTVTADPGGATCSTDGATTCVIESLTNGTTYRFAVTAQNPFGSGPPSEWSNAVTPTLLGWEPPPGVIPQHGTVVYLHSSGEYIGRGNSYRYTLANALITPGDVDHPLAFHVTGDQTWWTTTYDSPISGAHPTTGYWADLDRHQFAFQGDGRGCNQSSSDVEIDEIAFDTDGNLTNFTMRFAQRCELHEPPLYGYVRYDATDPTTPPPPGDAADFAWHPPAGSVPAAGDYLYLSDSDGDHFVGAPTILFDDASGAEFTLTNTYGRTNDVSVTALENGILWNVWMFGQHGQAHLNPGLYTDVQRAPFNNPMLGGFSIFGNGSGCNTSISTFAVDAISYDPTGAVASITARFVQRCPDASGPPLYGALRVG